MTSTATSKSSNAPASHTGSADSLDVLRANAIRALAMDAVEAAKSGHPGMPMGMAEVAVGLWHRHLRHNPANPRWADRDRFVLSNGHGSMLLYSLLHLTGYDLPLEELKQFRQLHSKTPGHPEVGATPGVETTTGPLGQGLANAVGMALAERLLAQTFNRPGHTVVDHRTYVFVGDGCLMEGISHEACSLAGTLRLSKLVALYDDNGISIDGDVHGWFTDNTPQRFAAYGWNVIAGVDGHDVDAIDRAIAAAQAADRPTLICCRTVIGKGAPTKAGTADCHGSALGEKEIAATRAAIGWPHPAFVIPEEVYSAWSARARGGEREAVWNDRFASYRKAYPDLAVEFERRMRGDLPDSWPATVSALLARQMEKREGPATRKASQQAIEAFAQALPEMIGGSADLTGSVFTNWSGSVPVTAESSGNYVNFGVREFAMAAIANGLALHGGFIPYVGTFLTFSDYARNALRMAALMKQRAIFVFTHDSIGLGEDGPTHQSVEHAASLRVIPGMTVWRPCDTTETAVAWAAALEHRHGPTCLLLTRQNVPFQDRSPRQVDAIRRGAYVLADWNDPQAPRRAILIATGSEVALAVAARNELATDGIDVRVVSMPSTSLFDAQEPRYRAEVLPAGVAKVAIEAGSSDGWFKYVGARDDPRAAVIGMDSFGESAPAGVLFKHFGFTVDNVKAVVRRVVGNSPPPAR